MVERRRSLDPQYDDDPADAAIGRTLVLEQLHVLKDQPTETGRVVAAVVLQVYRRMLLGYEAVVAERKAREGAGSFSTHFFDISDLQKIVDSARRPGATR
ncbi:hypothetical protein [Amycolatopsis kentuckyensis]|uniref:hypothetical protein n=1 Tax=Amycolatopsis kentuckyensis TaxID=218823 RepID=UPI000A3A424C|nr:hypothetical protein [Amycolatopsis kentuckyensis]